MLHLDTSGPHIVSGKKKWVALVIDEHSRYLKVFVSNEVWSISDAISQYLTDEKGKRGIEPTIITDPGSEFKGIRIYEQTHLLNGNVVYNERIPQIILAPTADKQFNGLSERTVQTLSRTHNAITSHISQSARDKYFDHSYKHAAALYNITPHQATGKPPSEIYLGATKLPKTMPMFLQDGLIKVYDQPYIIKAYFLGYDTYGRFLVMRMDTHQEIYCTTFRPLNSFEFHTMDVSFPGRPFRAQFNSMKVINSARLANSIKKKRRTDLHDPLYIPTSFEDAMQNNEFRQAIKKEMTQFTELEIEQPVYTKAELESVLVNGVQANLHHLHDTITLDDPAFEDYPAALREHILEQEGISEKEYQQLTGILQYIATKGRFDIQFHASVLAQYNHCPNLLHYHEALQVLKYLYRSRNSYNRYQYKTQETTKADIKIYTDASLQKGRSQAGYIIFLNNMIISSKSFKIKTNIKSTYECELLALYSGIRQALLLRPTMEEMGFKDFEIHARCDNKPLTQALLNKGKPAKLESLPLIAFKYLSEKLISHSIDLQHVNGNLNPADILTKQLATTTVLHLMQNTILNESFHLDLTSNKTGNQKYSYKETFPLIE
ncbi:unnamed protein product [Ambrosiozyma monospora]|uniref:Unnamed protein product n=1 Tax=Ambrosiozyma monospora TaxID=43982 RepID=A0A9W6Z3M9_AMBMO|nr:unnamed protein product [Ambrosiozyma monospora]